MGGKGTGAYADKIDKTTCIPRLKSSWPDFHGRSTNQGVWRMYAFFSIIYYVQIFDVYDFDENFYSMMQSVKSFLKHCFFFLLLRGIQLKGGRREGGRYYNFTMINKDDMSTPGEKLATQRAPGSQSFPSKNRTQKKVFVSPICNFANPVFRPALLSLV